MRPSDAACLGGAAVMDDDARSEGSEKSDMPARFSQAPKNTAPSEGPTVRARYHRLGALSQGQVPSVRAKCPQSGPSALSRGQVPSVRAKCPQSGPGALSQGQVPSVRGAATGGRQVQVCCMLGRFVQRANVVRALQVVHVVRVVQVPHVTRCSREMITIILHDLTKTSAASATRRSAPNPVNKKKHSSATQRLGTRLRPQSSSKSRTGLFKEPHRAL